MSLLANVHEGLPPPRPSPPAQLSLLRGTYFYYHYGCDGTDDRGWGCGYRTLQTLCSWLLAAGAGVGAVPGLRALQEGLVATGDKPPAFAGSRDWVGTVEAAICLDRLLGVPCKLVHIHEGRGLAAHVGALHAHFRGGGGPVMMGGGTDHGAKGVLGVCSEPPTHYLLVLDPHYWGGPGSLTREGAQTRGWVCWWELGSFEPDSFYNLCLPQLRLGRAS
ncbi:inactive Ufm1-specific protease 1 [Alligator mississippiensis]|uniref:inactive Ufm1-specific protease 1 n=1 Tax=Alligator mississippiensis TaxID=8496 RepID=UPI0003D070DC|nr:inactive Ufm1-specific protease 1 [Alligator mississippiensis]